MSAYYYNSVGQRFGLRERPLEPPDDIPLRYCVRCRCEIYHGGDALCGDCQKKTIHYHRMLDYMKANPDVLMEFLEKNVNRYFLDRFFQAFEHQCEGVEWP